MLLCLLTVAECVGAFPAPAVLRQHFPLVTLMTASYAAAPSIQTTDMTARNFSASLIVLIFSFMALILTTLYTANTGLEGRGG